MAGLVDIMNSMAGSGKRMDDDIRLDSKVKEAAIKKLDEARDMIDKEGLDGAEFIMSHLGGERSLEEKASSGGDDRKKAMIILQLKKKNGKS